MSADIENWTSADTKSEPPGSDGGDVVGCVSSRSWCFLATVIAGGEAIDSGCGLWAGQGGQCPYSRGDGRAGGRDGNPRGGGGDAPAAGAGLEPAADRDGVGHPSCRRPSATRRRTMAASEAERNKRPSRYCAPRAEEALSRRPQNAWKACICKDRIPECGPIF